MTTQAQTAPATTTTAPVETANAGTGAPPAVQSPGTTSLSPNQDWTAGIQNEDLRGWVQNKQYKDVHTAVEAHRNLEKLLGVPQDRVIKLPENREDVAAMGDVYKRLGRPDSPDGYGFKAPEGGNKELTDWASKSFHELGLSSAQGKALFEKWNAYVGKLKESEQLAFESKGENETKELQKKWGLAFDQNAKIASKGARSFGVDTNMMDQMEKAWGYQKTMEFFHRLGASIGEHSYVEGSSGTGAGFGVMTPAAAQSRITSLRQDPDFVRRYTGGDSSAVSEMDRLHQMAYPSA